MNANALFPQESLVIRSLAVVMCCVCAGVSLPKTCWS